MATLRDCTSLSNASLECSSILISSVNLRFSARKFSSARIDSRILSDRGSAPAVPALVWPFLNDIDLPPTLRYQRYNPGNIFQPDGAKRRFFDRLNKMSG